MKIAIYNTLNDIPEADRGDYKHVTETGSPNFNKYVLDLDPQHPVAVKNVELLSEKSQRDVQQQQAIVAAVAPKETEITTLKAQLAQAQTNTGVPAGQVAVAAADALLIQQFKGLGDFDQVKKKVDEYPVLIEEKETTARKELYAEAAKAHGLDPDAFTTLAEQQKLHEKLEKREVPDPKKPSDKVTHFFVKGKDAAGTDTSTVLGDFIKNDNFFKPFQASLTAQQNGGGTGNRRKIPDNGVGDPPETKGAGTAYINSKYRPAAKKE